MKLSIVIPTLNEEKNIIKIYQLFYDFLKDKQLDWNVIFIDDNSKDNTISEIKNLNSKYVSYLVRKNEKGLSSAIFKGIEISSSDYVLIIDADLQYRIFDFNMFLLALNDDYDLILGSRTLNHDNTNRIIDLKFIMSRVAWHLSKFMIGKQIPDDLMTGFFIIKKSFYKKICHRLRPIGFKALLEIFLNSDNVKYKEIKVGFVDRELGKSKLNLKIIIQFFYQLLTRNRFIN